MKTRKILATILAFAMLIALFPVNVLAAVSESDRPNNLSTNLTIGILNDSRTDGHGEFPNEPSVTGYTYYYLRSGLTLSSSWFNSTFSSNAGNYINISSFWNDERIVKNSSGNAFGYYSPTGLDLKEDSFFTDYAEQTIYDNKAEIIQAYLDAENINQSADDFDLLFYVLKYETGYGEGYHLDAKVVAKNDVVLSYDANRPDGVTADIFLPPSSSVASGSSVVVSDMNGAYKSVTSSNNITYQFNGWNTAKDGSATGYSAGETISVTQNTTLYAQWSITNAYTITWLNYNDTQLFENPNLPYGTKIGDPGAYYAGPTPQRPDSAYTAYTFAGWELVEGNYDDTVGLTSDLTYKTTYSETIIKHKATVEVVLDATFAADGTYNSDGTHIDISTVSGATNTIYLKKSDGTGEYIALEKETDGVYCNNTVENGEYYIYIDLGGEYQRVGTQELTIQNANRTRYLPYYSVTYVDGSDTYATEYYYIGSNVHIIKEVPTKDNYVFCYWTEGSAQYSPSTHLQTVTLTENITAAHILEAYWVDAASVKVTVVVNHNGRTSPVSEELTIHLTHAAQPGETYNEVSSTAETYASDDWNQPSASEEVTFDAGTVYENLSPEGAYGIHAAIPGYRTYTDRPGGYISIIYNQNENEFDVTYYLIYDPSGYELPFTVKIADDTPERMIPEAVNVKVTRWNSTNSQWEPIPQHESESVEVVIDKNTLTGTGSVHVWGFVGGNVNDPYLYRVDVVQIDLGDYYLEVSDTDNENYVSKESGFFPAGAYTAFVEVTNSDLSGGTLPGAHANPALQSHGAILATVAVHPYHVELEPNGGEWDSSDTSSKIIENRFTVPQLLSYVPTRDGYSFDGWYVSSTQYHGGEIIKDVLSSVGATLTLTAQWRENITVKGTVIVDLGEYICDDNTRTVSIALQKKENGIYGITVDTQIVSIIPVPNTSYAVGEYEFTDVADSDDYHINVFAVGGLVTFENEPGSNDAFHFTDSSVSSRLAAFTSDKSIAVLDGDKTAVVNVYMTPKTFALGYMGDASLISPDFRPTSIMHELRHDHISASGVEYAVIKNTGLGLGQFDAFGLTGISTVNVPRYHANGRLYDYLMPVLSYHLDAADVGEQTDWDDRHYYHYTTTPGYTPAPFSITYEGPAEYCEIPITIDGSTYYQDVILKAIFTPNIYTITYDLQGGSWDASNIGPTIHKWSFATDIPQPVYPGYTFTGWTVNSGTFDALNNKIPANVWENVSLSANWERDIWNDGEDNPNKGDTIPDKYQAHLVFEIEGGTWDGSDNGQKNVVVTLKEFDGSTWQNILPEPVVSSYLPAGTYTPVVGYTAPGAWVQTVDIAVPEGTTVYTYKFTMSTPNLTFNANGGHWENDVSGYVMHLNRHSASYIYNYNDSASVIGTAPVRAGYVFDNWYTMDDHGNYAPTAYTFPFNITDDTTVYAKWTPKNYTVHYDLAGGSLDGNPVVADRIVAWDDSNLLPSGTLEKSNYIFAGWKKDATEVDASKTYAHLAGNDDTVAEITLVAQWTYRGGGGGGGGTSKYTLTYETNGGNSIPKESYSKGTQVTLTKIPVKEGYVFEGWYEDKNLTESVEQIKVTKNITVYAKWVEDNGSAGNGYHTPDGLNGKDHFAYVVGYPDGTVRPNENISRAEVTAIFFRLLNPDEVREKNLTTQNNFADVNDADWYNAPVSTMSKLGIVNGRYENSFVPDAFITRAEFATICARFDNSEFEVVDTFTDVSGHWAEHDIHEAAAHGWIRGYEDGTFCPDRFITRAEAMTMINRVLNRIPETADDVLADMINWPDNSDKSAWYYLAVQEATNSHDYVMKNHIYEKWTGLNDATDWTKYE